jgi:hypothetical protein
MAEDFRKQRGQAIAETCKIEKRRDAWVVPSQSSSGRYLVRMNPDLPTCTYPDWELREVKCKHIFAVECVMTRGASLLFPRSLYLRLRAIASIPRRLRVQRRQSPDQQLVQPDEDAHRLVALLR